MGYEVTIRELPAQPVLTIRRRVPRDAVGAALSKILPMIASYLERCDVAPAGPPFARYFAAEQDAFEMEGGIPVAHALPGEGEIVGGELPAGPAAVTWHLGPYDGLSDAYAAIEAWLEAQGRQANGAPWEVYWTDPEEESDPAKLQTEVLQPIA